MSKKLAQLKDKLFSPQLTHTLNQAQFSPDATEPPKYLTLGLEKLRPNTIHPRLKKNEKYDEIKTSIRQRGLDNPPPITQRPGDDFYIISDGGNTRLQILKELYQETQDERFLVITCLYKPWVSELHSLIGHLAENELHSDYTFIEKALGIDKARKIYEEETDKILSTRQLAEKLTLDGYPISKTLVARMEQTLRNLLPAIPDLLHQGLGRPQIERLLNLRNAAENAWHKYSQLEQHNAFDDLFVSVLKSFNNDVELKYFDIDHVKNDLTAEIAKQLNITYDLVLLELDEKSLARQKIFGPTPEFELDTTPLKLEAKPRRQADTIAEKKQEPLKKPSELTQKTSIEENLLPSYLNDEDLSTEDIHPIAIPSTHDSDGDETLDSELHWPEMDDKHHPLNWHKLPKSPQGDLQQITNYMRALPLSTSPYKLVESSQMENETIVDIWRFHPQQDNIDDLKKMAHSIALDMVCQYRDLIKSLRSTTLMQETPDNDIGFFVDNLQHDIEQEAQSMWDFLRFMSGQTTKVELNNELLFGSLTDMPLFNDITMVKILRLIRVARRIRELERGNAHE